MKYKLAIFDVDNTILSKDSLVEFVFFIFKKSPVKLIYSPILLFSVILKLFKIISIERLKSVWLSLLVGKNDNLESISKEFIDKSILKIIKPDFSEYLNKMKDNNYKIVFATASFEFYIKYLSEFFKADVMVGTRLFRDGKKITINGRNCKDKEKIRRIIDIIPENQIDKDSSVGFSDSLTDLPFLDLCSKFYLVDKKDWKFIKEY